MYAYNYLEKKEEILNRVSSSLEVESNKVPATLEDIKNNLKKKKKNS